MGTTVAAVYCDGWDDGIVNPLTRTAAQARDTAGEPYSVVLLAADRLHAVLDLAWADGFCGLSRYDRAGRLISRHEFGRIPHGELFLREARTWHAPDDVGADEFPRVAARRRTSWQLTGRRTDVEEPAGDRGSRHSVTTDGSPPPRLPAPPFGRWQDVLALAGDDAVAITDAAGHPLKVRAGAGRPWQPARPLRPRGLDDLFRDGAERALRDRRLRLSTRPAGPLHLPSGRLVAADPSELDYGEEPFTTTVAPGTYPVTISVATFTDDPAHERVAAARLEVGDEPTVRWEMALRAGQDPLDLGRGEFFGFGVDAGLACFVDEDNRERLVDEWQRLDTLRGATTIAGGDLVAWSSGWGDGFYPTWTGRSSTGAVTAFVADMLLFPTDRDASA